ncbi:hypothetical protein, partial [Sinorhizobium meliloti]|uniref:hypothetical protein n=1 Tax=Rhizobium meliloti TaxID=382 RepID=UPI001AECF694
YAGRLPQPGKGRIIGQQPVPQAKPERHGASACPHARSVQRFRDDDTHKTVEACRRSISE